VQDRRFSQRCVVFKTCITDARRPLGDGGYVGQIDAFAVYCPQLQRGFLVPINALTSPNLGCLRVQAPLNGQVRNIRRARDFELPVQQVELSDLRSLNRDVVDGDLVAVATYQQADAARGEGVVGSGGDLGAID
jgi:hypothetical protein